ncbi:transcriptional regulator, GntR family [Dethiosulfovibrio salsuginis]|uniref:Transcriptional regulator, GntR family n=1 Tax=Dethiosulfovibrio salsuginis TaxID=561720 RepID=A0A1X7KPZ4_9BACT|nr:transcriptional regulator, GntR family [Dethiosulfovibrio salsuginis]
MVLKNKNSSEISPTNKEKIYSAIKEKILSGKLQGGHQIRAAEVAKNYGVSGTPVREALIQLEGEGYVIYEPYKGAIVKSISKKEVQEIFKIRAVLECMAMETALKRMTSEEFREAMALAEKGLNESDPAMLSTINWDFHSYIYQKADMPNLLGLINSIRAPMMRYVRIYHQTVDLKEHNHKHLEIVKAGMDGEPEKAAAILKKNLEKACEKIELFLAD